MQNIVLLFLVFFLVFFFAFFIWIIIFCFFDFLLFFSIFVFCFFHFLEAPVGPVLGQFWAIWPSETERGAEIDIDRPVFSPKGAAGAEKWPFWPKTGRKSGVPGLEKWSPRPILVVGCSRSGHRPVELVEMKTLVFQPKEVLRKSQDFSKKSQDLS